MKPDLKGLDIWGHYVINLIEKFVSLSTLTAGLSLIAAIVCIWTMQVTTRNAGFHSIHAKIAAVQRGALALIAIFLVLNAVTPFITPDPPWLANLPLVIAVGLFMLVLGLTHLRAERESARLLEKRTEKKAKPPRNGSGKPKRAAKPTGARVGKGKG